MAGRYQKQKENKYSKLKRKKIPKAKQGLMVAEPPAQAGGMEQVGNVTKWGQTGAQVGGMFGETGKVIGGVIGAGVGIGQNVLRKSQVEDERTRMKELEESYDKYGGAAANPMLQTRKTLAEHGLDLDDDDEGKIEIEGKNGIGELHFDKNYNLKNVGTTPHSNGGDVVDAEEGDVVFPVQGKLAEQKKVMKLANEAKKGNKRAYSKLETAREKLPQGTAGKEKALGDGNVTGDFMTTALDGQQYSDMLAEQSVLDNFIKKSSKVPGGGVVEISKQSAPERIRASMQTIDLEDRPMPKIESAPQENITIGGDDYSSLPQGASKAEFLEAVGSGKYNWDPKDLKAYAKNVGANYTDIKNAVIASDPTIDPKTFGKGTTGSLANIGELTNTIAKRNYKAPTPESKTITTTDPNTGKVTVGAADNMAAVDATDTTNTTGAPVVTTPSVTTDTTTGDEVSGENVDNSFKPNKLNNAMRYGNVLNNTLDSMSGIEGYDTTGLALERYKTQDMTAPRLREANKANMVRRNNRQRLVGSKGQQVTQSAQDEVMAQGAADNIIDSEIQRKMGIENMNVDLANKENQFDTQEAMTKKNVEAQQRAGARNLGRLAVKESTDIADLNQQREYQQERNKKQDNMQSKLYEMMSENATREFTLGGDSLYNADGTLNDNAFGVMTKDQKERAKAKKAAANTNTTR